MRLLTSLERPFIVGVITESRPEQLRASIETACAEGADALEINLSSLGDMAGEEFRSLVDTGVPVYTTCRRPAFMTVYGFDSASLPARTDEDRMTAQLDLLRAGSVAIDIEMDTYDPIPAPSVGSEEASRLGRTRGEPLELSVHQPAVARQRQVVDRAHELGREVIMSCHTGRRQTAEQLVNIYQTAVARSADLVKIVVPCEDSTDLESLRGADARLGEAAVPYALLGAGRMGAFTRGPGGGLGSAWYIGRPSVENHWFAGQPLISDLHDQRRRSR